MPQKNVGKTSQRETEVKEIGAKRQRRPGAGTDETGGREPSVAAPPQSVLLTTTDTPGVGVAA